MTHVVWLRDVRRGDLSEVGEKNAMLGEVIGATKDGTLPVPVGFAVTGGAYREHLRAASLEGAIRAVLRDARAGDVHDIIERSSHVRDLILRAPLPDSIATELETAYRLLSRKHGELVSDVAVRASATCPEMPDDAFASQYESFLNVRGAGALNEAVRHVFASLFTPRAIEGRLERGIDHAEVAMAVGIQKMVRADLASAGLVYTADPETGDPSRIVVTSSWGLGESVVQERVVPDRIVLDRAALESAQSPIVTRTIGSKETKVVYDWHGHRQVLTVPVPRADRQRLSCSDVDAIELARLALTLERHFGVVSRPSAIEIEWAKDGITGTCAIVQARPESAGARRLARSQRAHETETFDAAS
jgi:pyruvate, water dikinase